MDTRQRYSVRKPTLKNKTTPVRASTITPAATAVLTILLVTSGSSTTAVVVPDTVVVRVVKLLLELPVVWVMVVMLAGAVTSCRSSRFTVTIDNVRGSGIVPDKR